MGKKIHRDSAHVSRWGQVIRVSTKKSKNVPPLSVPVTSGVFQYRSGLLFRLRNPGNYGPSLYRRLFSLPVLSLSLYRPTALWIFTHVYI